MDVKSSNKSSEFKTPALASALIIVVVITIISVIVVMAKDDARRLPTAEQLLANVSIPEIPAYLDEETVRALLSKETSISFDAKASLHYKYSANQNTWDYSIYLPLSGTLDICALEDGRDVVSVGGMMDITLTGPYIDNMSEHYEKSYFVVVNDSLEDVDIYMRENMPTPVGLADGDSLADGTPVEGDNTKSEAPAEGGNTESGNSVSGNAANPTQTNTGGTWQFISGREIDLPAFMDQWNADHYEQYMSASANSVSANEAITSLKSFLAKNGSVTEGSYKGTTAYVLSEHLDFKEDETRDAISQVLQSLESFDPTFRHWNLSQFLEYYGPYLAFDLSGWFLDLGEGNYYLLALRVDVSDIRLAEHISDRFGYKLKDVRNNLQFEIDQLYIDIIFLPSVPDSIKASMEDLTGYTSNMLIDALNESNIGIVDYEDSE